jgi:ketosteroid isomerase-like protein
MTEQEILSKQRKVFYPALIDRDWDALAALYADDYTLVRSDGTTLGKAEVLAELKLGTLRFKSIQLRNEQIRLIGSVALLTGESKAVVERGGIESQSHFRLTAVYVQTGAAIRLLHFQSTDIKTNLSS